MPGISFSAAHIYLTVAILAEVVATTALARSDGFTKLLPVLLVVFGYGLAFWCLSFVLKTISTGLAYAIWSGVGIVLITAIAWIFYDQKLDLAAIIGLSLIVSGVAVINLFSNSAAH